MGKWMDIREFQRSGLLQEVNRLFFHPRGLALTVGFDGDASTPEEQRTNFRLGGIIDHRDDGHGVYFGEITASDVLRGLRLLEEAEARAKSRQAALGFVVQPLVEYCHPDITPLAAENSNATNRPPTGVARA